MQSCDLLELGSWDVDRHQDGAVLVSVHSCDRRGEPLPDAVFTFRSGDPQHAFWESILKQREQQGGSWSVNRRSSGQGATAGLPSSAFRVD